MTKPICTIILNRNLPKVTDDLFDNIKKFNDEYTDIYVVEAGSDKGRLSKNVSWYADWKEAKEHGLRYGRGMNFGLSNLYKENKLRNYEAFLLLTNDTEFKKEPFVKDLYDIFKLHKRLAIVSPCSQSWGEKHLLKKEKIKYFWYIQNSAYLLRRSFIEEILNTKTPGYLNFIFDGNNFRGYGIESELIAKAYANNWGAAITSTVWSEENESYLSEQHKLIKTESYEENIKLCIDEGMQWMKEKYGFKSKWSMQMYVKAFYDRFFEYYPELERYRL